jgi:putative transposase
LGKSEARRLKVLEDENRQLKKLVADKELIIQTLNEILKKKLLTPAQKRQVIRELRQQGLSLRLALDQLQMAWATFYRQGRGHPEDDGLRERIRELAHAQVSFGYRRITAVLRRQGWRV